MNNKNQGQSQGGFLSKRGKKSPFRLNGVFQAVFMANRLFEIWHNHHGRSVAQKNAAFNHQKIIENIVSGRQENVGLGSLDDAIEAGFRNDFCGPFLGFIDGYPIFLPWDYHISTCSFPGGGKSSTVSIPATISLAMGKAPESIVVLDIKGEMSWCTAEGRAELDGIAPIFINPWNMNKFPNHCLNVFSDITDLAQRGHKIVDQAKRKIFQRFGDPNKFGANSWIHKDASRIADCFLVELATNSPVTCNPATFWDIGTYTHEEFKMALELMTGSSAGEGYVARVAKKLFDQYGEKSDQWEWVMETFTDAFSLYAEGSVLRASCTKTDFDARLLKDRPQAIYVMVPDKYIDSHGTYVADVLEYLVTAIASADGNVRTTFMLDEFVNIPRVQSMMKALRLYRSRLIRIWTFAQDRNGYNQYKDDGGYMPFEETAITLSWAVAGQHAKDLSEKGGYRSELVATPSTNAGVGAETGGLSASEIQVPNLPLSQISQDFEGKAILDAKSKIYVIDRKPWWEIHWLKDFIRDQRNFPMPHFEG